MTRAVTDVDLGAFLDGELDPAREAEVERAIAADAALARRLAALRSLQGDLHTLFDPTLAEPVPERLRAVLEAPPATSAAIAPTARVVPFQARRRTVPSASRGMGLAWAASVALLIGAAAGWTLHPRLSGDSTGSAGLLAAIDPAALEDVLESAPSGEARVVAGKEVMPALTFAQRNGAWCRQFRVTADVGAADAIACRDAGSWRVVAFVADPNASVATDDGGGYTPATGPANGAQADSGIDRIVDGLIAGTPLEPAAESRVIARGWREP